MNTHRLQETMLCDSCIQTVYGYLVMWYNYTLVIMYVSYSLYREWKQIRTFREFSNSDLLPTVVNLMNKVDSEWTIVSDKAMLLKILL